MDYYMFQENVVNRLVKEWKKHKNIIIAYDYDNTVFDYHDEGHEYNYVIDLIKRCEKIGAKFVVFTSCEENKFDDIRNYLLANRIPFDTINKNVDGIEFSGRKIYYNILLDDRAGLQSAYEALSLACSVMEND